MSRPVAGSFLFDPDNRAGDDFGSRLIDPSSSPANLPYYQASVSIPTDTSLTGKRFQVRLFEPQGARLDEQHSVGTILEVGNNNRLNPVGHLKDGYLFNPIDPDIKPGDPVVTLEQTMRVRFFFTQSTGGHQFQGTAFITFNTQDFSGGGRQGTARRGIDFNDPASFTKTFHSNTPSDWYIDIPIPAQTQEGDEWFGIGITGGTQPGINTNVPVWPRRWARAVIGGNPADDTFYLDTSTITEAPDSLLTIPWYVLPGANSDLTLTFWMEPVAGSSSVLTAGRDFPPSSRDNPYTLKIQRGQHSGTIHIPFWWFDNLKEAGTTITEVFRTQIRLHFESSSALSIPDSGFLVNLEYDRNYVPVRLPLVAIQDDQQEEDQPGLLDFQMSCDLMPQPGKPVTVDWATLGISASPSEYDIPSPAERALPAGSGASVSYQKDSAGEIYGQVTFTQTVQATAPLQASIRLAVTGDTLVEANEKVLIRLTHPYRCQLEQDTATGTIRNDDLPGFPAGIPFFRLLSGTIQGTNMAFTAVLTHPIQSSVTFDTTTLPGTALATTDFLPHTNRRQVISPGQTSVDILVPLVAPIGDSADEAFTLVASGLSGNARPQRLVATGIIPAS